MGRRLDAERLTVRFLEVYEMLTVDRIVDHDGIVDTFEELLRAEVVFPGPSLYANPPEGPV
jgi:hypothetical protein